MSSTEAFNDSGFRFIFGDANNPIIYEITRQDPVEKYNECQQLTAHKEWPLYIYLDANQLEHVQPLTLPPLPYPVGTTFTMGSPPINYKIDSFDGKLSYYKCSIIPDDAQTDESDAFYLAFHQMLFVSNIISALPPKSEMIYSLSSEEDAAAEIENLKSVLPYFTDFVTRQEKSVLNQNDYADDPSGYLRAILKKYNIRHPRQIAESEDAQSGDYKELRPWIEGKMEKLMAQKGYFGNAKWKTRHFRLFDEALVWFDDQPSFFKRLFQRKAVRSPEAVDNDSSEEPTDDDKEWMRPFGVLPLAMVTALKTCDVNEMDGDIAEEELLRLELEVGDEGVIILKCSDFNQRIKWYECLHTAIFTVKRPLFTKDRDLWRIAEPKPEEKRSSKGANNTSAALTRQLTKEDVRKQDQKRKQPLHVRMGQSLHFNVVPNFVSSLQSPGTPSREPVEEDDEKEIEKDPWALGGKGSPIMAVPSTSEVGMTEMVVSADAPKTPSTEEKPTISTKLVEVPKSDDAQPAVKVL